MKLVLAVALTLAAGFAAFLLWGIGHERNAAGSSSQIFIHGTPVCVTQQGGRIEASVGECVGLSGPPGPEGALPPGHPPIGSEPVPEEGRRTLI